MEILLNADTTANKINEEFRKQFPYLKLIFYKKQHSSHEGSLPQNKIDENELLKNFSSINGSIELDINENNTVSELENMFKEKANLNVQVFRHSGKVWIQTTTTDDWSLINQNEQGKEMSVDVTFDSDTPDYQEQL